MNKSHELVAEICSHLPKSYLTQLAERQSASLSSATSTSATSTSAAVMTAAGAALRSDELPCPLKIAPTNIVLDGAEAMCVVSELIDSCSVLDESHGLSLLNETQYESLLQCLQCWQRHYCSDESSSKVPTAAAAADEDEVDDSPPFLSKTDSVHLRPLLRGISIFQRKKRSWWTEREEEKIYVAVQKHGVGHWAAVVSDGSLPHRTNVDIKDKWRTMKKRGRLTELRAKFGPVGHTVRR